MRDVRKFLFVAFAALSLTVCGSGQTVSEPEAPNAWMKKPANLKPDPVSPAVRSERDRHFDGHHRTVLTPENAANSAVSEGSIYGPTLEIPANVVLAIGKFVDHRSVLSAGGGAIYTEMEFDVSRLYDAAGTRVQEGSRITVINVGGTVQLPDGRTMSYLTHPKSFFVRPGRTYLLALEYRAAGDFYFIYKTWDLSDGRVRPNSLPEVSRARRGEARLAGLTTAQLEEYLKKRFLAE